MRRNSRSLIAESAPIVFAAFFAWSLGSSSAQDAPLSKQDAPFKTYTLGVYCGSPEFPTAGFFYEVQEKAMGNKEVCAGKCRGTTVSLADALAQLPAVVAANFRTQVARYTEEAAAGKRKPLTCLGAGKEPPKDQQPKNNCAEPTPWFDGLSPAPCKNRQAPQITDDGNGIVLLKMCGWSVYAYDMRNSSKTKDLNLMAAYKQALRDYVQKRIGSTVCCDKFLEQARPETSCDPRRDFDCDGISTGSDRTEDGLYPDLTTYGIAEGVTSKDLNPFPLWFQPGDKNFMPDPYLCDCKWAIMKATLTCSPNGIRPHVYQIRWVCPSTGNQKFTRKEEPATSSCGPDNTDLSGWWQNGFLRADSVWAMVLSR